MKLTVRCSASAAAGMILFAPALGVAQTAINLEALGPSLLGEPAIGHVVSISCPIALFVKGSNNPGWWYLEPTYTRGNGVSAPLLNIMQAWKTAIVVDEMPLAIVETPEKQHPQASKPVWNKQWDWHVLPTKLKPATADWMPTRGGSFTVRCAVDAGHKFTETNESDNIATKIVEVPGHEQKGDPSSHQLAPVLPPAGTKRASDETGDRVRRVPKN